MTKLRHVKPLLRNGLCCRKKTQIVTLPKTTAIPQSTEIEPISRGHNARGQGQGHKKNPRPRIALPRTDPLEAKERNASRPKTKDTGASVLQKTSQRLGRIFQRLQDRINQHIPRCLRSDKRPTKNLSNRECKITNTPCVY